jgi:predicted ArsR family transcriptional regulator
MLDPIDSSKNTRDRVLHTLLINRQCTINELAESVDINPISVRHHIARLEADGLVSSAEERHGVGRPRRNYFLTDKGRELFPTRYVRLTLRLLQQLKDSLPTPIVNQLFANMAENMAAEYSQEFNGLSIEAKLNFIKHLLTSEGFTVDWERHGDFFQIRETNCPYYHIGQDHPEICSIDQTLISTVLSLPAEKIRCMLHGDENCTYLIPVDSIISSNKEQQ